MINISSDRGKYVIKPNVPAGTENIEYNVVIGSDLVFIGKSKYYGGDYEVDCSDFLESYIAKKALEPMIITSVVLHIDFIFDSSSVQSYYINWTPTEIFLPIPVLGDQYAYLTLTNSGFMFSTSPGIVQIPLSFTNGVLDGKTINKLDKVTYMDRYGDYHNGGLTNHYELECFIDPCWMSVVTGDDLEYEKVMMAMQNSPLTTLVLKGVGISGMKTTTTVSMNCKVKDIEKIETYSSYSVSKRIPSYKITIEVYK